MRMEEVGGMPEAYVHYVQKDIIVSIDNRDYCSDTKWYILF